MKLNLRQAVQQEALEHGKAAENTMLSVVFTSVSE